MAWTLYHAPVLEVPYAHVAHAARSVPGLHTLFREATDRLTVRLVRTQRQRRRVRIGSVAPLFDVSSFTVKGQYFSHVPYEPGATAAVLSFLKPGAVFVDIGANTGYFTILAALQVGPLGRVVAFEPNPVVSQQLKEQVEQNAVSDRVTVGGVAIADRDEDGVRFYVSCLPENDGISSLTPEAETLKQGGLRPDSTIRVNVRTFDSWLNSAEAARLKSSTIDLIKIDVEGAEARVLKGMSGVLMDRPPVRIICETRHDSDACRFLIERGYRMSMLDEIPGGIPNLLFEHA
jgi:FkbM family methyltransferase